jgi:peptide/nickel transport system permease protein
MLKLIATRLAVSLVTLFGVAVVIFAGTQILPGDIAQVVLGQNATPEGIAAIREQLGLDRPAYVRFFEWLWDFVRGDFGGAGTATLFGQNLSINEEVAIRLGNTLMLASIAVVLAAIPAIALAMWSAVRPRNPLTRAVNIISVSCASLPDFFVAYVFIAIFAVKLRWFPAVANLTPEMGFGDALYRMALPILTLVVLTFASILRLSRAVIADILSRPYIEMVIMKGLPTWRIVVQHALPNAVGPIVNILALSLAILIAGTVVLEVVFVYPGMGRYMVDAVARRDIAVVQACSMIFASFFVGLNFLADLTAIVANPRLRYPK